ncbi:MarR family transcriptional regulator [Listeria floridensis FSL S10-1187]|uniref:MarR family transcriptional regulator n=1 Tax=Listeria floridensis FSL S10-1187 TaxID=1265817 RepID=A0ABN0RCL8_9LIST|nr:MarR family transcriptional regulator [Listeria floridensis]EUJ27420.1 MarR family transcriptional regulator [Listeria floridensis FSL S10-1187]
MKEAIDHFIDGYMRTYLFALKEIDQAIEQVDFYGKRISMEQFFMLRELCREENGVSATQLSCRLNVNKSAVSAKIKNLEEKGFLVRSQNPFDRRAVVLHVSDQGREIFKVCEKAMQDLIGDWLRRFGKENSEMFMTLYDRLIDLVIVNLERGGKDQS